MVSLVTIALVAALFFAVAIALYFYVLAKKNVHSLEVEPFDQFFVGVFAAAFAILILFLFYFFVDDGFQIKSNLGQVGDFVGGLTNPVLSFIGLIVLLRTTLIQTNEARKTSVILLEQQKLFEQERFESSFYQLLERYEAAAEGYWRKSTEDGSTYGLKTLHALRARREEFDSLPLRIRLREIEVHVNNNLDNDKHKKVIMRVWRVVNFISGSSLSAGRKKYYFSILVDAMEPCEVVILLSMIFLSRRGRKRLREYCPSSNMKSEFFVADIVCHYYRGR